MASRQTPRQKKAAASSPSSSATSSSRQAPDAAAADDHGSPALSSARSRGQRLLYADGAPPEAERSMESVTVTVRFRPLSPREIRQGDEIAWYADGDTIVRNEHNPTVAYAYDGIKD